MFSSSVAGGDWKAEFDWRQEGEQTWDIHVETTDGLSLSLRKGGSRLEVGGAVAVEEPPREYEMIYERFAALLDARASEVHEDPLRLIADALTVGRRTPVPPFLD